MPEKLNIKALSSIQSILDEKLFFLDYSTQKRNLAYKIQYYQFMAGLKNNYTIYGSINGIFAQQLVILCSTICECLLYCYLVQIGFKQPSSSKQKNIKYDKLINAARCGFGQDPVISKNLSKLLKELNDSRNHLHPERQQNLHPQTFTIEQANKAASIVKELLNEIERHYFLPRN